MSRRLLTAMANDEGHMAPFGGAVLPAAGMILVGVGAANDAGWLAIAGGIIAGLGLFIYDGVRHTYIDKGMFGRIDKLESKKD